MSSYRISIYQTLENRDNPGEVEEHGPYKCTSRKAWLGEGYYFWDTFILHAHEWGQKSYRGRYFICEGSFLFDWDFVFDIVGNMEHIRTLDDAAKVLRDNGRICTVAKSLEVIKRRTNFCKQYVAIRAKDEMVNPENRLRFVENRSEYMSVRPRVQICFFDKSSLRGCGYRIIYPERYMRDAMIDDSFTTI